MEHTIDIFLRILTLVIYTGWRTYWRVMEVQADKKKQKTRKNTTFSIDTLQKIVIIGSFTILFFQFIGIPFLQFQQVLRLQFVGIMMVVIGVTIAVSARIALDVNWANSFEYQIKEKQSLITSGIYQYIRHPIYTGVYLMLLGGTLVAHSYLIIPFSLMIVAANWQAKREEALLLSHFGKEYALYMKQTKRLIPFLW